MLATLLTTIYADVYGSGIVSQQAQSIAASAYIEIDGGASLAQSIQSITSTAYLQINGVADVYQQTQSLNAQAYLSISGSASLSQATQSVSIDGFFRNQSAFQALQSVNIQAFEQIDASVATTQATQLLAATLLYYDVGINANIVQPAQAMASVGFISLSMTMAIQQSPQLLNAYGTNQVITSPTALNTMSRDRILRSVRNKGSR